MGVRLVGCGVVGEVIVVFDGLESSRLTVQAKMMYRYGRREKCLYGFRLTSAREYERVKGTNRPSIMARPDLNIGTMDISWGYVDVVVYSYPMGVVS